MQSFFILFTSTFINIQQIGTYSYISFPILIPHISLPLVSSACPPILTLLMLCVIEKSADSDRLKVLSDRSHEEER